MIGGYAWQLIQVYSITVGFSLQYNYDPRLLPSGNSVKYHVEAWLLQPMKQYIITTRFEDVLHCLCFVSAFVWCPCMAMNVSVSYNGGPLPDILLLTQAPIFVWFDGNIILLLPS